MRGRTPRLHRERLRTGSGILADVAPLVAMQDRGDEEADGDARGDGAQIEQAADCVERSNHHERSHQEEDEGNADRPELVLERRRRVRVAAYQAGDTEGDDWPAAGR